MLRVLFYLLKGGTNAHLYPWAVAGEGLFQQESLLKVEVSHWFDQCDSKSFECCGSTVKRAYECRRLIVPSLLESLSRCEATTPAKLNMSPKASAAQEE